ncbi:MAG TPA: methyltransferase domain-containing protein [Bryobacteraceae bacterium]|nr:methyltransferase domain-containing protein [Bryobacteraceae bacterium]
MQVDTVALVDAADYYNQRHERGWMDVWPESKKTRVVGFIQSLKLPVGSKVLEYGCGPGVFTEAVKERLPLLEVHGCDISSTAVAKARTRCPHIEFHLMGTDDFTSFVGQFDLIYTHHVLEHVTDLTEALRLIASLLKPGGKVLHIAPCGNKGSLEERISALSSVAGVDGRFTTDDSSHVRRLTSHQLVDACSSYELTFEHQYFANHLWGSIEYLTNYFYGSTLLGWLNPLRGIDSMAKVQLFGWASVLYPLSQLRHRPRYVLDWLTKPTRLESKLLLICQAPFALACLPFSVLANRMIYSLRDREWRLRRTDPTGAEMYLLFSKPA